MCKKIVRYLYILPWFFQIDRAIPQGSTKKLQDFQEKTIGILDPSLNICESYIILKKYDM
jgi:hypothetical protein